MSDSNGAPPRKTSAKKAPAKKATAKKAPAKKAPAKKAPAKKAPAKKATSGSRASTRSTTSKLRQSSAALAKKAPTSNFFRNAQKRARSIIQDPDKMRKLAEESSSKAGGKAGPFAEVIGELKTMVRLVTAYAKGDYRDISAETLLLVVGALIYVVSPIDLIPDAIPGVGLLDDVAVVTWVVGRVRRELDDFRAWERK